MKKDPAFKYSRKKETIRDGVVIEYGVYMDFGNNSIKSMCNEPKTDEKEWGSDQHFEKKMILDIFKIYKKSTAKKPNSQGFGEFVVPYRYTLQQTMILGLLEHYFKMANEMINAYKNNEQLLRNNLGDAFVRLNKFISALPGTFREPYLKFDKIVIDDPELFYHIIKGGFDYLSSMDDNNSLELLEDRLDSLNNCIPTINLIQKQLNISPLEFTNWNWVRGDLRMKFKKWLHYDPMKFFDIDMRMLDANQYLLDASKEKLINSLYNGREGIAKILRTTLS